MGLTRDQVIEALRWRYDFYSSRAVAGDLIEAVAGDYDAAELDDAQARALYERVAADPLSVAAAAHLRPLLGIPEPAPDSDASDGDGDDAKKKAEAKKKAAEEEAKKKAAEEEAKKKAAEEEAKKKAAAEEEAKKKAAEEEAKKKAAAEEEAKKKAAAEEEAKKKGGKKADDRVELSITLTGAPKGKDVIVVGNLDELGAWKPAKGLKLTEAKGSWSGELTTPAGTELEYKFVSLDGDKETWEGGDNRKLTAAAGEGELKLTWQS